MMMTDNVIMIVSILVGILAAASLFFFFVMPNAAFHGLKLKYVFVSLLAIFGSLLIFLIKARSDKKDEELEELERQLKIREAEASLAINLYQQSQNDKKIAEVDKKIADIDSSLSTNDDKVKSLEKQREVLKERQSKIEADIVIKNKEKSDIENVTNDILKRLGD